MANGTTSLAGASSSVYVGTNGISCGTAFKVTKAGKVTIYGGTGSNAYLDVISTSDSNNHAYVTPNGFSVSAKDLDTGSIIGYWANYSETSGSASQAYLYAGPSGGFLYLTGPNASFVRISAKDDESNINCYGPVTATAYYYYSSEEMKKNIELCQINALDLVKNSDTYTYNYKNEDDTSKKHIGFVIGEGYNTPAEVINGSGEGIDAYSMTSIAWKAIQELSTQVQNLQERITALEGE